MRSLRRIRRHPAAGQGPPHVQFRQRRVDSAGAHSGCGFSRQRRPMNLKTAELQYVEYEVADRVAVITLNRPDKANAQHYPMLHELNRCWNAAAADEDVRVILLKAKGRHFSAGHDLAEGIVDAETLPATADGKWDATRMYANEAKVYLGYSLNWRNIPKPSIAAVQGKCIAGGLMLCWPCDLIIAADNAEFSDPVVKMGIGGVEYHGHTWELGARK